MRAQQYAETEQTLQPNAEMQQSTRTDDPIQETEGSDGVEFAAMGGDLV